MSRTPSRLCLATLVAAGFVTLLPNLLLADKPKQGAADKPHPARAAEERIEQALLKPSEFTFENTPLNDVTAFVTEKFGVPVILDERALAEAGMALDEPISFRAANISLESALRLMFRRLDLTYLIRNEVLLVTNQTAADAMHFVVVYPVADLATTDNAGVIRRTGISAYANLVDLVQATVTPMSWATVGGMGAIEPFAATGTLVVSQSWANHAEIRQLLERLRSAREEQKLQANLAPNMDPDALIVLKYDVVPPSPPSVTVYGAGGFGGGGVSGGFGAERTPTKDDADRAIREAPQAYAEQLAKVMMDVIEPDSWKHTKGQGTIHAVGGRLVVRNTMAVQEQVAALLRELR